MTEDERAIRDMVDLWMSASKAGDHQMVLDLMTDDAIFMVPGREPFGKEAFEVAVQGSKDVRVDGRSEIQEIHVLGDWAWLRNRLEVAITPPGGETLHQSGYTLTILRKDADGRWRLMRDANLLGGA